MNSGRRMQSGFKDFLKNNKKCRHDFQDFVNNEQTNDARIFKDLKKKNSQGQEEGSNKPYD